MGSKVSVSEEQATLACKTGSSLNLYLQEKKYPPPEKRMSNKNHENIVNKDIFCLIK